MASQDELVLPVDWEYIDACPGFTFDVGNSVFKLLYVSPKDWVEPQDRKQGSKGCVRFINFPLDKMDSGYQFIKDHVRVNRESPEEVLEVYSSGAGAGAVYADTFKKELNINNKNLPEFECFVHCLLYMLKNLPRKEVTLPIHRPAFEANRKQIAAWLALLPKMSGKSSAFDGMKSMDPNMEFPQEKEDLLRDERITDDQLFPCGLAMCGTGFGFFMVNEDGTYSTVDNSHRGGKMFMGLGSLLTGAKTFPELMDLCTRGDAYNVSTTSKSWMKNQAAEKEEVKAEGKQAEEEKKDDDLYAMMGKEMANMDEMLMFCFGEAQGKDISDFRKEDIARCLLETMITDLVHFSHSAAKRKGLKHVFFCCGFMSHPLVREITTTQWVQRDSGYSKKGEYTQAHFLTHGHAMGAIGAFLNHKQKWSEKSI